MYLSNIKLWNFRKFGKTGDIDLENPHLNLNFTKGLNVLVGENDSGKSAIIDAVKLVLKTHSYEWIRITDDDFFDDSKRFRIELRFDGFKGDEAKHFTEWLGWDGTGDKAKPYLRLIFDVKRSVERVLPSDVKAGVDNEGSALTAGAREYLKVTYLKPLRDASRLSERNLLAHFCHLLPVGFQYLIRIFFLCFFVDLFRDLERETRGYCTRYGDGRCNNLVFSIDRKTDDFWT